jgi:uncharacterized membrane protein YkvA (DUF1232 family)
MKTGKIGEEFVTDGAQKVTDKEVEKVVAKSEVIKTKFGSGGPLHRFFEDGQLLLAIVKDYWGGKYRQVPYATVAAAVFTLIYVLNPLDLIPDFLPIIGQVDDAAVVAGCLLLIEHDLRAYQRWKQDQESST